MSLKVKYESQVDVLYLAKEGQEEKVVEIYPGVNLEMDADGELIGIDRYGNPASTKNTQRGNWPSNAKKSPVKN